MRAIGIILAVFVLACSGSSNIDGSGGSSTSVGGATGGATSAGGTGAGTTGGNGGTNSTGGAGGGPDCPDIACSKDCPDGIWLELDGCARCACASELEMAIRGVDRAPQNLSFDAEVTEFIGGIDRWIFDLTWTFDDPQVSEDTEEVVLAVAIMRTEPQFEPAAQNATWCTPENDGMPFEYRGGTYTLHGLVQITGDLTIDDGFLSIRRNGNAFEGHAYFDLSFEGGGVSDVVHVAAPFSVAVP